MKQLDRAMIKYEYYVVIEVRRHMHIMQKRCLFLLHCYIALVVEQFLSQYHGMPIQRGRLSVQDVRVKSRNGRGVVTNVGGEENSLGSFDASLSAYDLLRGRRCCQGGSRAAALDITGLTNLEGSASSSLDDLGERFLAGGTSKLMGRSRCEGG